MIFAVGQSHVRLNLRGPPCFSSNISAASLYAKLQRSIVCKVLALQIIHVLSCQKHACRSKILEIRACSCFLVAWACIITMLLGKFAQELNNPMSTGIGFRWLTQNSTKSPPETSSCSSRGFCSCPAVVYALTSPSKHLTAWPWQPCSNLIWIPASAIAAAQFWKLPMRRQILSMKPWIVVTTSNFFRLTSWTQFFGELVECLP